MFVDFVGLVIKCKVEGVIFVEFECRGFRSGSWVQVFAA